ncbi:Ppx/GppA phosphatase family protein [Neptunitalea lumnitzerae]|uniref:Exopolyphosphatase n=1 Tax=Neptunitalea lumnitzerae TaxID=2965509 RepID=A0ABQ5ML52_9FLAO|nr:rod shape-determining protein [Neptunitalea sp. Y10]GLB50140.1 exopolyphosphatase [Neptunitalea sp. Y10]
MKVRKFAAIDIGSNAVRLLIANVMEMDGLPPTFSKSSLVRVPIRLGTDVFLNGGVSDENAARLLESMQAFKLLMGVHKVEAYRACATSAMREASNGAELTKHIKKKTGVDISIIDGSDEAAIIANTDLQALIEGDKTYLYVDVGGGSTEFTVYSNGETVASRSFKIGTVRILNEMVKHDTWVEVEQWIKNATKDFDKISLIGSGGNINKIFKISGKKDGTPLSYKYLSSYYQFLMSFSYEERISILGLNQDRADVIIPAARIYLNAMKWSKALKIYVPKIGLSDGIVKGLYYSTIEGKKVDAE